MLVSKYGERRITLLQQISIGGCFTDWEENIYPGDEFRLEIDLPNGNRLPLKCKAIYRFEDTGIGVRFVDITQFEQEFISKIISERMRREGLPDHTDPFCKPPRSIEEEKTTHVTDDKLDLEMKLEEVMSGVPQA